MKFSLWLTICAVALSAAANSASAKVIYVRAGAKGAKDGTSWADAYSIPSLAAKAAQSGDEIWVAAGTYPNVIVEMPDETSIYGGFAGIETERAQRDWRANKAVVLGISSGDLSHIDGLTIVVSTSGPGTPIYSANHDRATFANCIFPDSLNRAVHIRASTLSFTDCEFRSNHYTQPGGAIYSSDSTVTLTRCIFEDNSSDLEGGAMYNVNCAVTLTDCAFTSNSAKNNGGGIYNKNCTAILTDCAFTSNTTIPDGDHILDNGGAVRNEDGRSIFTWCTFRYNDSYYGGAVYDSFPWNSQIRSEFDNCTFEENSAYEGGALYNTTPKEHFTMLKLSNCLFVGNRGGYRGGALWLDADPEVRDSIFAGNSSKSDGGAVYLSAVKTALFTNCIFRSNSSTQIGGALHSFASPLKLTDCSFIENMAYSGGGLFANIAEVNRCNFHENKAEWAGGGAYIGSAFSTVQNSSFHGNVAPWAGGLQMTGFDTSRYGGLITNCTMSDNRATTGGGIQVYGNIRVSGCTIFRNTAARTGGGIFGYGTSIGSVNTALIVNSLLWDNTAAIGSECARKERQNINFQNCGIRGSGGSGALWDSSLGVDGGGNIALDPLFVNAALPAGPDGIWRTADDGLRLQPASPCVAAGRIIPDLPPTDILGSSRVGMHDLGAYETPSAGAGVWIDYQ